MKEGKEEGRSPRNSGFRRIQLDTGVGSSTKSLTRLVHKERTRVTKSICVAQKCPSSIPESPRCWASAQA